MSKFLFPFAKKCPILSSNLKLGYEAYYLEQELSAISLLQTTGGELLEINDIANIMARLSTVNIVKKSTMAEPTKEPPKYITQYVYNFGNAGVVAAEQILSLVATFPKTILRQQT